MIKEVNDLQQCPFASIDDYGAYCNLTDNFHCWCPTQSDFPKGCILVKEENVLIKFTPIKLKDGEQRK